MKTSRRWRAALAVLALAGGLLAGCGEDAERTLNPPEGPDYLANDSPDNVIANLVIAWEAMDAEGYAALLYDGIELATDGQAYAPYKFYYDRSLDPDLPVIDLYDRELVRTGALLGGEEGMDSQGHAVPGVRSVSMDLNPIGVWTAPIGPDVDGDPYPEDARWRSYTTNFLISLKGNYGENTSAWLVQDWLIVHCIPVQVGANTEWRLWKWRDVVTLARTLSTARARTEESSFSSIKALY